jgi:hypothetical protein
MSEVPVSLKEKRDNDMIFAGLTIAMFSGYAQKKI